MPPLEAGFARVPERIWSPVATGLIALVPGLVGLATGSLLLFPSLGPTALIQAHTPEHPSARFYNIVVSHLGALGCASFSVALFGLSQTPSVFEMHHLCPARVGAAVLALVLGTWLEILLRASHPPAASAALLVALGSFRPTLHDTSRIVIGVLIVASFGEGFRRLCVRRRARVRCEPAAARDQKTATEKHGPGGPS